MNIKEIWDKKNVPREVAALVLVCMEKHMVIVIPCNKIIFLNTSRRRNSTTKMP